MPIIKNYGFLWERKYIWSGTGGNGNSGHLLGYRMGESDINFRDQIGVYVLYDKNQSIVYVGQAGNGNATLFRRLINHTKDHLWNRWEYFSWVGFKNVNRDKSLSEQQKIESNVSGFSYSDALNEIEGILIEIIEPRLNKQSGKFGSAKEYFQTIDERVKDVSNGELSDLLNKIAKQLNQ